MTDSSEATTYSLLEIFDIRAPYHKYYRSIKKFGQEKTFQNLCRYLAHVRGVVPGLVQLSDPLELLLLSLRRERKKEKQGE